MKAIINSIFILISLTAIRGYTFERADVDFDGFRHHDRPSRGYVTCSSIDRRFNRCGIGAYIYSVRLSRQISKASCVEGQSWGFTRDSIWVDRGCRAEFEVYYQDSRSDDGHHRGPGRDRDRDRDHDRDRDRGHGRRFDFQ